MDQDSLTYDSLDVRPLPKWLTDQRDGLNTVQPARMEMKDDRSLAVSFILTGAIILLAVTVLTVYFLRKKKKKQQ
jgi:heme/copper-type cytochrome/quinol oxidase subunit 2